MKDRDRSLISIIIPTRNRAESLEKCLLSIIALSCSDLEIVVVYGASDDNTPQLLEHYADHLTAWISEPDQGIYDALNKGCGMAHGDFFYFLGSDDTLTDQFCKVENDLIDPGTIYYGDVIFIKTGKKYAGPFTQFKLARTNISHQAIFYPRTVFSNHRYSLKYPIQADWELNMKLWGDPEIQVKYINVPVAFFAESGISSSQQDISFNQDYLLLIKKYFPTHIYIYRKVLSVMFSAVKSIVPDSIIERFNKLPFQI